MRAKNSKRLVIDTDVAQASGGEDATDTRSINCRDFLKGVMTQNHRIVMTRKSAMNGKDINLALPLSGERQWMPVEEWFA